MKEAFFRTTLAPLEKTIEQVYVSKAPKATDFHVEIAAEGHNDGTVLFYYKGKIAFMGEQEVKRNVSATRTELSKQLLQLLHYHYQKVVVPPNPPKYNYKVFILNSSKFFAYVYLEDLTEVLNQLVPLFKEIECSASQTWNQPRLQMAMKSIMDSIPIVVHEITDGFKLNDCYREMYLHCLD